MKKVSIIVVNYNCHEEIEQLIGSLLSQDYLNYELIVIDNNSPDRGVESLAKNHPQFKFIFQEENKGFAGANNVGIKASKGEYIFLLNADTLVDTNTISELVKVLEAYPQAGSVSPKLIYHKEQLIQYAGSSELTTLTVKNHHRGNKEADLKKYGDVELTAFNHGAAMLLRKSVIKKVGLMPEEYFLYYEELDWCTTIKSKGFGLYYTGKTSVQHKASASTGRIEGLKSYFLTRNRVLYVLRKYPPGPQKLLALSYLFFVVYPKNMLINIKNFKTLTALTKAVIWNIKYLFKTNLKLN